MLKKVQVVMLPTNEKAYLVLSSISNKLFTTSNTYNNENFKHETFQHLYFLSDEEIKEGDWYMISAIDLPKKADKDYGKSYWRKIIATTDSLGIGLTPYHRDIAIREVLHPSQSFLEVYIREYNRGNIIKEVMVEYEYKEGLGSATVDSKGDRLGDNLKINPKDNTITIKRVKESWSREEVKKLILAYKAQPYLDAYNFEKWIEQNL